MTMDDQDTISEEASAETLRMVLPLLSRHGIPPTPPNYAVWYSYIIGDNPALKQRIDEILAADSGFTPQLNEELYRSHILEDSNPDSNKLRGRIAEILGDLIRSLGQMGADTGRYEKHLEEQLNKTQGHEDLRDLEELLNVLAEETKGMRQSTQALKQEFERKSQDIQQLQTELEEVKRTATSDPLTALPNRRALLDALNARETDSCEHRHSLLMLDIDHFKEFNDTHGHLTGDRVLRFVADVIRQQTKGQDTPARFGGEEFAILLPETPLAGALAVAESIRYNLANAKLVRAGTQQSLGSITLSIGAATCKRGEDPMELIERADQALYLAKERGRNRVVPETEL